ncbi:hypothetical protein QEJ31_04210 [Pigmentibacter sp. JX0631]|uniref:hypothetical protein n=1 Tax=Pigmentibacter sp. JX0631 TaxID=2976982 RepID=UPI00246890B6|nr:hypothetical protein [Pigmentibacter sp. JX0631]WGL60799.1 hypothetical protein QEJ31_04210 [Pigmentibacter sp. JX0631]
MKYFGFLTYLFFAIIISTSCRNNSDSEKNILLEEGIYPKISINKNYSSIGNNEISEVIAKGKYINCFGRKNDEIWQINNFSEGIENQLFLKKDDIKCNLNLIYLEINTKNNEKFSFSNEIGIDIPIDNYDSKILQLIRSTNTLNTNYSTQYFFKIKKLISHNIEIIFSNIEEKLNEKNFYSSVFSLEISPNLQNKFKVNQFYSETIELKNNGTSPVKIENFLNEFMTDENCLNKILQVNETCQAKLFLPHTSISKRNFSLGVEFKYPHAEAETKEFKKDLELLLDNNSNSVSNSNDFNELSIFRVFKHENLLFVAVNSADKESLYVSKNGVNGQFNAVNGIPKGIEIRGLTVHNDKIYVVAFKHNKESKKGGVYFADLNNPSVFKKIEKKLNIKNSIITVDDFVSIANNGRKVYLATKQNGLFSIDNNNINLQSIPVKINGYNFRIFQDIFAEKNNIFAVRGKDIFYSKNGGQNFIQIATDIPIVGRNISQNEIKSLYTYEGRVVLGTNSGLFFSKSTAVGSDYENVLLDGFVEDLSFKNNDIYDMKLFGDSLYIAAMCFVNNNTKENGINCTKENGIYTKKFSLSSEVTPLFKKDPTGASSFLGVLVTQDDIIAATNMGFKYLNSFYPKKLEMNSVLKIFKAKDKIYILKSGQEKGLFVAKNFGKDEFTKIPVAIFTENNDEISFDENNVIALTEVNSSICLLIRSNVNSRGLYCSKNGEKLNFYLQNKFSNFSMVGLENVNNNLVVFSNKNILLATFSPQNSLKLAVIHYASQSDYNFSSVENIQSVKFINKKLFLLTEKSLYYSEMDGVGNWESNIAIKFKKIALNIPVNINLKNIYFYNNYVLFSTSHGLYASTNGLNGVFKKSSAFNDNAIDNLEGFFHYSYIIKNENMFLLSLNEDLNFNKFVKNNEKLIKVIEGNNYYYIISENEIRKKKSLSLVSSVLLPLSNSTDQSNFLDGIFYQGNMYFLSSNFIYKENSSTLRLEQISYNDSSLKKFFIFDNELYIKGRSGIFKFKNGNFVKNYDFSFEYFSTNLNNIYFTINNEIYFTKDLINFDKQPIKLDGLTISAIDFTENKLFIGTNKGLHIYNRTANKINSRLIESAIKSVKVIGNSLFVVTTQKVFVSKDFGNSFTELTINLDRTSNAELEDINFSLASEKLNLSGTVMSSNGYYIAN